MRLPGIRQNSGKMKMQLGALVHEQLKTHLQAWGDNVFVVT